MYYVKSEDEFNILSRAEKTLGEEFHWNIRDDEMVGFLNEDICSIIDDLCSKIDMLQEQIDDQKEEYEEMIRDFYNPKSPYEIYGVSKHDFH